MIREYFDKKKDVYALGNEKILCIFISLSLLSEKLCTWLWFNMLSMMGML